MTRRPADKQETVTTVGSEGALNLEMLIFNVRAVLCCQTGRNTHSYTHTNAHTHIHTQVPHLTFLVCFPVICFTEDFGATREYEVFRVRRASCAVWTASAWNVETEGVVRVRRVGKESGHNNVVLSSFRRAKYHLLVLGKAHVL